MDGDFWIWTIVIGGIFAIGAGAIAITTLNPLGNQVPFSKPVTDLSIPIETAAQKAFQSGVETFEKRNYADAIDAFNQVMAQEPNCAE
ncbi:MAG: hypothetical protein AAFU71_15035, partial [Cyanobacteria bacterium J06632_22]